MTETADATDELANRRKLLYLRARKVIRSVENVRRFDTPTTRGKAQHAVEMLAEAFAYVVELTQPEGRTP